LPPTRAGWARFLELAKASGHPFRALRVAGQQWWHRSIPQDLLSRPAAPPAEPVVSETPAPAATPKAPPAKPTPAPKQPVVEPVWENNDDAGRPVSEAEVDLNTWMRRLEAQFRAARISPEALSE